MAKKPKDPGPSAADVAQVEVSGERFSMWMSDFRPAAAAMVKRASAVSAGERYRVRGETAADTAGAFKELNRTTISASSQVGQKAGSGGLVASMAANARSQGEASGMGKSAVTLGARLDKETEQFRAAQIGSGIADSVQTSLSQAGRRQTQVSLQKAILNAEKQNRKVAAGAAAAGAIARKYGPGLKDKWQDKKMAKLQADAEAAGVGIPGFEEYYGSTNIGEDLVSDYFGQGLNNRFSRLEEEWLQSMQPSLPFGPTIGR